MKLAHSAHTPIRTCLVCGRKDAKFALLRVALSPVERTVLLDPQQRLEGRGAYVCEGCLPRLSFTKRVQKAFRNKAMGLAESIGRESQSLACLRCFWDVGVTMRESHGREGRKGQGRGFHDTNQGA